MLCQLFHLQLFSPNFRVVCHLVYSFLCYAKLLSLTRSHWFIFCFYFHYYSRWVKEDLLQFMLSVLPMFSFKSCIVSGLTFKSLIHFEFIFVNGVGNYSKFILLHAVVQFSQHHLLGRGCFFSIVYFCFLCQKIRCPLVHGFVSRLSILFHWSIFLFLCQYHTVLMTIAFQFRPKSGRLIPPAPFFYLTITLASLLFSIQIVEFFFWFCENAFGNLIRVALNL